jgi:DNA-nicking Smr family endonuclease
MRKLDLHGFRHEEARRETIRFVEDNWGSGEEVFIVSGNSNQMKKVVATVLDEYKLDYTIDVGHIKTCFE